MELRRIDTLWHFFATQNHLFLKKEVENEVVYRMVKADIELAHQFKPNFLEMSNLIIRSKDFQIGVQHYAVAKKRFGIKVPVHRPNEKLFFPKELLKLSNLYNLYVEKDQGGQVQIVLTPFIPKNTDQILKSVNLITQALWKTKYFSETIKN